MKADTLLDYAALQLSHRETRYDVFLSGGGETEKLDPGLPKSLLEHLPAAQELVDGGGRIFKLELLENENEAPWFTKGTVERFVRFVNTPELLEKVNAIQAEMAQLNNARNFNLAPNPLGDGDQTSTVKLTTDGSTPGTELKSRKETVLADASRSHLLRAIDVRLMTLHYELKVALARATAAGFSVGQMANLIAFSERFGANRLREACAKFVVSCQQREQQVSPRIDSTHKTLSGPFSKHGDKSYENTVKENQLSESYAAMQPEQESLCSSSFTEDSIAKPPVLSTMEEGGMEVSLESVGMASRGLESMSSDRDDQSPVSTKRPLVRSASPRARRSASPMRRVQIARSGSRRSNASVIRSINYFPERSRPNRDSSSDSDYESAGDNEESGPPQKTESTRRFSVQDAINLFERKQRQQGHSTEEIKKNLKAESRRLSAEIGASATCEKTVLRRWSGAGEIGKADVQSSTLDRGMPSLANGKDTCLAEAPPQSEFRPIEDREDVRSRFSSAPKITELQKISVGLMDRAGSQYSAGNSTPKENRANDSSATNYGEAQGLETTDSFPNSGRHGGIESLVKQQFKSECELNQELPEKAHQLGPFFAADESRSQAVEEPMYTGNLKEVSQRPGMVPGGKDDLEKLLQTMQNVERDSLSNSWSNKMDFDMQILMNMVDSNHSNYEEQLGALDSQKSSDELRGRFYDQYREKREAKLREEHVAKKAEKEAKLKAMQDALERRKAEMAGKSSKSSEKRDPSVQARHQAQKLQSSKSRLPKYRKELHVVVNHDDEAEDNTNDLHGSTFHKHDQKSTVSRSASGETPSSTPRISKDLSKTNSARKISSKSPSPATARSPVPSSSPSRRSAIPKVSNTSSTSTGRRRTTENPLTRSVPNLTDLKKENIKALPGRSGSSSNLDKSGPMSRGQIKGSGHNKSSNNPSFVDVNGSRSISRSSDVKVDKKNRRQASKKISSSLSEIKSLPATVSSEESVLTSKPSFYSKVTKKSSVVPLESKPFLRKGSGIGPGVGPGVAKMKASPLDDTSKTVEDEVQASELKRDEIVEELRSLEPSNVFEGVAEENELQQPVTGTAQNLDACGDLDTSQNNMQTIPAPNEVLDSSEDCLSSNFVSDVDRNNQIVSEVNNCNVSPAIRASSPCARNDCQSGKIDSSAEIITEEHVELSVADALSSERPTLVDATLPYYSSSGAMGLNSELGNQTSSKSHTKQSLSQMLASDTDADESRKKWGMAQKPILISQQPQKDAPKGFKRLLKFGRKSRYETGTTDWVSVPECDEDTEESKDPSRRNGDGLLQRGAQAKGIGPGKLSSERSCNLGGVNSFGERSHEQSPATGEEHLSGANLLKAPRSFFSLSSFRSKGGDSKSR